MIDQAKESIIYDKFQNMKPEIQKIMESEEFQHQGGVIGKDYELYMEPMEPALESQELEETQMLVRSPMIEFISPPQKIQEQL